MQGANLRGAQVAWDYLEQAAFSKDLLKETSMCSFFFLIMKFLIMRERFSLLR